MAIEAYELFDEAEAARQAFLQDAAEVLPEEKEIDPNQAARIERALLQLPDPSETPLPQFVGAVSCKGMGDMFAISLYDDEGLRRGKKDIDKAVKAAQDVCARCVMNSDCNSFASINISWMPNADHLVVWAGQAYAQAHPVPQ